jgi:hypothetical protein
MVRYAVAGKVLEDRRRVGLDGQQVEDLVATPDPAGCAKLKEVVGQQSRNPRAIAPHHWIEEQHLGAKKLCGNGFRNWACGTHR